MSKYGIRKLLQTRGCFLLLAAWVLDGLRMLYLRARENMAVHGSDCDMHYALSGDGNATTESKKRHAALCLGVSSV